jgi:ribosomal protein S18 acetylase RimI-like enzyme
MISSLYDILAVGYDFVMILPKNRHLDAATAILGNRRQAKALLDSLQIRKKGRYQFFGMPQGHLKYVALLVHNVGNTTTFLVSPPKTEGEVEKTTKLIRTSFESLQDRMTGLAQTVMETNQPLLARAYENAGFQKLSILTYMERVKSVRVPIATSNEVSFVSMEETTDEILQSILENTYIGSLDCPKIHGLRQMKDIVEGHRNQGSYDAQLWTIAQLEYEPVGVLLLSPLPEASCMELSYLGIIPAARGKGIGDALVNLAVKQATNYGLPRIVLAVDAANTPATALYERWNFRATRQRLTLIRQLY